MRLVPRMLAISPSATLAITAQAARMRREGRDVIALSAGQPDFPTPEPIAEAARRAIASGKTGYTPAAGIPELREAVARKYSGRHGIPWESGDTIICCGAKHAIASLVMAATGEGEAVLLPSPFWVSYPEMIRMAGGVPMVPEGDGLSLTAADLEPGLARGARGVILNSPNNPTGLVIPAPEMERIADLLRAHPEVWVISDDIYEDLCYIESGPPHLLQIAPDLADRVAVVSGVSKTYSMTGWRIGWAISSNREWIGCASRIQSHTTSNPCSISQWASLAAVEGAAERERLAMLEAFRKRRDLVCGLLDSRLSGHLEVGTRPEGAFYVFARVASQTPDGSPVDSTALCGELLDSQAVALIPGAAFGREGFLRVSFAASEKDITIAVERTATFFMGGVPLR
ncbi:pyridoxal phosphate-dependent aminotransferase [Candidatus Fermentibacterales bacterium]|nr:pyridoxal phosphate-dependent aminotransferase [Candidatus Fermentibacterales bacterium]